MWNAVPTLDTTDDTGTQYYSKRKEKKNQTSKIKKENSFHDRPFCSDCEIFPACFLQNTLYLVRGTM